MVIRMADGRETTIDYREMAPAAARSETCSSIQRASQCRTEVVVGPLASGVPGSVAGMALAQRRYGRLPLAVVIAPAIALARDGFEVSWALADSLKYAQSLLARFSVLGTGLPARRRHAARSRRSPGATRPRQHPHAHRGAGTRRLLQGRDRRSDRRRDGAVRRPHHQGRSGGLHAARAAANHRLVSRPSRHLDAAAQLRWHRPGAVAQHPRELPAWRLRPQLVARDSSGGRGGATRVCGSLRVAGRPRLLQACQ